MTPVESIEIPEVKEPIPDVQKQYYDLMNQSSSKNKSSIPASKNDSSKKTGESKNKNA